MKYAPIAMVLVACGGGAGHPTPSTPVPGNTAPMTWSKAPLAVEITGEQFEIVGDAIVDSSRRPLVQNARIASGSGFELTVTLGRPGYVYLLQFRASGEAELLYPSSGESATRQSTHRIPSERDVVLQLDDVVGREVLYAIVSENPLSEADQDLAALVEDVSEVPEGEPFAVAYEEPPATTAERVEDELPRQNASGAKQPKPAHRSTKVRRAGCPPTPMKSGVLNAKSPCPGSALHVLNAKGVVRRRLRKSLVEGTCKPDGVGAFVIVLEHVPAAQ